MALYIILGALIYIIISGIVYFIMQNEESDKKWLWTIFWPIGIFFEVLANGFFWF
jgi:hypothetical protein